MRKQKPMQTPDQLLRYMITPKLENAAKCNSKGVPKLDRYNFLLIKLLKKITEVNQNLVRQPLCVVLRICGMCNSSIWHQ